MKRCFRILAMAFVAVIGIAAIPLTPKLRNME